VRFHVGDVSAGEMVASAEALVMPQAKAKGLELAVTPCDPDLLVRADPDKLLQILANLLSNAIKFTEPGGRVAFRCEASPETVAFRVTDTGIGIPSDKLEEIFEPFVQLRSDLTRTADGTGLGLAISRDLARGMSGDLIAESIVGEGSSFTLTLPRTPPGAAAP